MLRQFLANYKKTDTKELRLQLSKAPLSIIDRNRVLSVLKLEDMSMFFKKEQMDDITLIILSSKIAGSKLKPAEKIQRMKWVISLMHEHKLKTKSLMQAVMTHGAKMGSLSLFNLLKDDYGQKDVGFYYGKAHLLGTLRQDFDELLDEMQQLGIECDQKLLNIILSYLVGQPQEIQKVLNRITVKPSFMTRVHLMKHHFQMRDYDQCIDQYNHILQEGTPSPDVINIMARVFYERDLPSEMQRLATFTQNPSPMTMLSYLRTMHKHNLPTPLLDSFNNWNFTLLTHMLLHWTEQGNLQEGFKYLEKIKFKTRESVLIKYLEAGYQVDVDRVIKREWTSALWSVLLRASPEKLKIWTRYREQMKPRLEDYEYFEEHCDPETRKILQIEKPV